MKILVVDDNTDVFLSLKSVMEQDTLLGAEDIASAKRILLTEEDIDAAVIDVCLGGEDGVELLKYIRENLPLVECVMISGYSTIEKAVASIKLGAYEFIEKPLSYQKLRIVIRNALEHRQFSRLVQREIDKYRILGESGAVREMNRLIDKAAETEFSVLITGESGSGKEHAARLIHLKSKRGRNEIVVQNCAAVPANLFESEMFGYEKGAFTGAVSARKGKFEMADDGTLFLDEIGELEMPLQAKLLRVLEDKEVSRLGSEKKLKIDFRLVCATNRAISEEVSNGGFREDLFYRIGVIPIEIPPLRKRPGDIPLLAEHFLRDICRENGIPEKHLTQEASDEISAMKFPGNIRELKNLIQRLAVFIEGTEISPDGLRQVLSMSSAPKPAGDIFTKTLPYAEAKAALEKAYVQTQLEIHGGNISRTAIALGILPNNLMRKMKDLNIK
ncbi:MAG: hypothetical protein A2Y33_03105 [Spirochaetes bacterium GWF1_51_8]|nr:MAG: hypothetical protein A2Y33_03105 [Spirochaetes bacterium GWF1_51_8]